MFVCLQSLGTEGALHHLTTLQNNEPVPQVIERGCRPVLFILSPQHLVSKFFFWGGALLNYITQIMGGGGVIMWQKYIKHKGKKRSNSCDVTYEWFLRENHGRTSSYKIQWRSKYSKFQRSGVLTPNSLSRPILKVCALSRVEAQF